MLNLSSHYYEFGPFRLDLRERLLLREGQPLTLTPKTFNVLAVLVRRSGSLVEKDELLSEVWPNTIVEESSLSQKIYQLRKILDDGSGQEYIQTVPRHGYRFVAEVHEIQTPTVATSQPLITEDNHEQTTIESSAAAEIAPQVRQSRLISTRLAGLVGVICVLAIAGAGIWVWRHRTVSTVTSSIHRVAVLPFKVLGNDAENETLGLGLADALIGNLSRLNRTDQITVLPTNAVSRFSGPDADSSRAGHELSVDGVVSGTVQRIGGNVRVSAQLTRVSDNQVVWAGQFDRESSDIFELQDSISLQLAQSLKLAITQDQKELLTKRETNNANAYESYATAIYFWNTRSKEGIAKAIDYFQKAISLDPSYAKAYAGLSDCYLLIFNYGYDIVDQEEAFRRFAEAAHKSIELDDDLAAAHLQIAQLHFVRGEYRDANREFQRALELDPGSSVAHQRYSNLLFWSLQMDQAAQHTKIAQELDPASPITNVALAYMLLMKRDYTGACKYGERGLELDKHTPLVRITLAAAYEQSGKFDDATKQYQELLPSDRNIALAGLAHVAAVKGQRDKAALLLSSMTPSKDNSQNYHYNQALVYVALGENSKAIESFKKLRLNPQLIALLRFDPQLDALRNDHRFAEFVHAHGLDEKFPAARRAGTNG
jgi:DNA-binding winged helix-turn-helix (wHTH) protein/TolB-like protein/lipopolysaccharide biosynthesis regulator YciM